MGKFDAALPQPATPFPCLPAQALASTLMMPRAHPGPGGEVLGTGNAAPIGAELGAQELRRSGAHPRHGVEEGHGRVVRREALSNFRTDACNGLVHIRQRAHVLRQ